jgi:hypothetical protein
VDKKVYCGDCGAEAQFMPSGWRCPWATESHHRTLWVEGTTVVTCGAPYARERSLSLPTQTRTR